MPHAFHMHAAQPTYIPHSSHTHPASLDHASHPPATCLPPTPSTIMPAIRLVCGARTGKTSAVQNSMGFSVPVIFFWVALVSLWAPCFCHTSALACVLLSAQHCVTALGWIARVIGVVTTKGNARHLPATMWQSQVLGNACAISSCAMLQCTMMHNVCAALSCATNAQGLVNAVMCNASMPTAQCLGARCMRDGCAMHPQLRPCPSPTKLQTLSGTFVDSPCAEGLPAHS